MRPRERASLIALIVGVLLLGYPLVNVANQPVLVSGVPLLYVYLFALWLLGVGAAWLLSRTEE
ncbi:MAG TPA: hypothetical protein VEQ11_00325 [Chloroflexota bacterium]|nr:hypothetical protein [Chloroflexota bacterium]